MNESKQHFSSCEYIQIPWNSGKIIFLFLGLLLSPTALNQDTESCYALNPTRKLGALL